MDIHGPYKATKLWNDIIRTFRTSMPVGRHRKGVRVYDNCFCASDAADWLQLHLSKNPNFGSDVGRHQIVQLLGKFHKSGVFRDVRGGDKYDAEPFEDSSSRLFKFSLVETTLSPLSANPTAMERAAIRRSLRAPAPPQPPSTGLQSARKVPPTLISACGTPMRPVQQQPQQLHRCQLSDGPDQLDLDYVWQDTALTRLRELLELRSADELTDVRLLRSDCVRANLTASHAPDPADTLPDWVANAVRCLARWPDTGMRSLPSYEGFELDIFAALCEFFEGRDPDPLVPCELRALFVNVLALADNLSGARAHNLRRQQQQQLRRRRRRGGHHHHHEYPTPPLVAMTTSCAEIMRQIAPQSAATDSAASATAEGPPSPLRRRLRRSASSSGRRRLPVGGRCGSDCGDDYFPAFASTGACASSASASASALPRWPPPPIRRSAASEAEGLGSHDEEDDDGRGGIHPIDSDSLLVSGLQLAVLFLPPGRRRRLHQLLRVMHRLGANHRLRLDPVLPTPHVVLHSLAACALRKDSHAPQSQQQLFRQQAQSQLQAPDVFDLQLVAFMTAHCSVIFRTPAELRESVEARLVDMRALRMQSRQACSCSWGSTGAALAPPAVAAASAAAAASSGPDRTLQFCSRIPAEQFSLSGRLTSDQALLDLLEGVLRDENLPAREKKRKLRLFKESHPHVYSARFPDAEVERSMLDGLREPPRPMGLLGRTLTALKNWRL